MYRCVFDLEQHRVDDQCMSSKYHESDSKHAAPSVLCSSRGALMWKHFGFTHC